MKLWDKSIQTDKRIEIFTVGRDRELDLLLARYDVLGSVAHILMLESIGLLTAAERIALQKALIGIHTAVTEGKFIIEEGVEDVHSQVELLLTRQLGDTGKKVHAARSRNDQVLLDIKLFIREAIQRLVAIVGDWFTLLVARSEQYRNHLMPGYTHLQVAMPSSFGLWYGAYAESLTEDLQLLLAAYRIADLNPLGSAAGYGSSFPIDREMTTRLLGFGDLHYNVVNAQMSRGNTERITSFALSALAATAARMSGDICLYASQNFGLLTLPDELTTGSSIMPHKKNPDVFELIRARCNKIQTLPVEISQISGNLVSGYFRDMQIIKESFLPVFGELESCLGMLTYALEGIEPVKDLLSDERYRYIFSVEEVNKLVQAGVPFREAYKQVAAQIEAGSYRPDKTVHHSHAGSIGKLCTADIIRKMEAVKAQFHFEVKDSALAELLKVKE